MTNIVLGGSTPSDGFELKSVRFEDGSSSYLRKVFSTSGNRRTWTYSLWAKPCRFTGTNQAILYAGSDAFEVYFYTTKLKVYTPAAVILETSAVYRDPSAWYHIVLAVDTTQSTAANRVKLYVNGDQVTAFGTANYPAQNLEWDVGHSVQHSIAAWDTDDEFYDGYLAEVYMINGSQLTPSYFGETNELTNQWLPKNPTDIKETLTFGTNGFYLPFSNDALADSFTDTSNAGDDSYTFTPTANIDVDYLVVAGGGGGGAAWHDSSNGAGGGGAGGIELALL